MIELSVNDVQEIITNLFGAFIAGYCVGWLISTFKKFWSAFS